MRTFQARDEFYHRRLAKPRARRRLEAQGGHPINSAVISPAGQIKMFDHIQRNVNRFENLPIHVETIERAIGRVHKIHGPKPDVGRAHEVSLWFDALRCESNAGGNQPTVMDEIILRIAGKNGPIVFLGISPSAVNGHASPGIDDMMTGAGAVGWADTSGDAPAAANV